MYDNFSGGGDNKPQVIMLVLFLILASFGGLAYYFINKEEGVETCKNIGETCGSNDTCCNPEDIICYEGTCSNPQQCRRVGESCSADTTLNDEVASSCCNNLTCTSQVCTVSTVPGVNTPNQLQGSGELQGADQLPLCSEWFSNLLSDTPYPNNGIFICDSQNKIPKDNSQERYHGNSINTCCRERLCSEWVTSTVPTQACDDGYYLSNIGPEGYGYSKEECCSKETCIRWRDIRGGTCGVDNEEDVFLEGQIGNSRDECCTTCSHWFNGINTNTGETKENICGIVDKTPNDVNIIGYGNESCCRAFTCNDFYKSISGENIIDQSTMMNVCSTVSLLPESLEKEGNSFSECCKSFDCQDWSNGLFDQTTTTTGCHFGEMLLERKQANSHDECCVKSCRFFDLQERTWYDPYLDNIEETPRFQLPEGWELVIKDDIGNDITDQPSLWKMLYGEETHWSVENFASNIQGFISGDIRSSDILVSPFSPDIWLKKYDDNDNIRNIRNILNLISQENNEQDYEIPKDICQRDENSHNYLDRYSDGKSTDECCKQMCWEFHDGYLLDENSQEINNNQELYSIIEEGNIGDLDVSKLSLKNKVGNCGHNIPRPLDTLGSTKEECCYEGEWYHSESGQSCEDLCNEREKHCHIKIEDVDTPEKLELVNMASLGGDTSLTDRIICETILPQTENQLPYLYTGYFNEYQTGDGSNKYICNYINPIYRTFSIIDDAFGVDSLEGAGVDVSVLETQPWSKNDFLQNCILSGSNGGLPIDDSDGRYASQFCKCYDYPQDEIIL